MKEVSTYIQPFALGSLLQNLEDISCFPVSLIEYKGFGRKIAGLGHGKVSAIDVFKNKEIWKGGYAA